MSILLLGNVPREGSDGHDWSVAAAERGGVSDLFDGVSDLFDSEAPPP